MSPNENMKPNTSPEKPSGIARPGMGLSRMFGAVSPARRASTGAADAGASAPGAEASAQNGVSPDAGRSSPLPSPGTTGTPTARTTVKTTPASSSPSRLPEPGFANVTARKKSRASSVTNAGLAGSSGGGGSGPVERAKSVASTPTSGTQPADAARSNGLPTSPKGSRSISPRPVSASKEQRRMSSGSIGGHHSSNNIAAMDHHAKTAEPPSLAEARQKADSSSMRNLSTSAAAAPPGASKPSASSKPSQGTRTSNGSARDKSGNPANPSSSTSGNSSPTRATGHVNPSSPVKEVNLGWAVWGGSAFLA